jgi:hypothetical protein
MRQTRLSQPPAFDSTLTVPSENCGKNGLYSFSDTHGAPNGAGVTERPASHDAAPTVPASDDPLPLDPPLVPERSPLAAPVLTPLAAPELRPFGDPVLPLILVPLVVPELLPLIAPVAPPLVWPEPLPLLDPDAPLLPEPASLP